VQYRQLAVYDDDGEDQDEGSKDNGLNYHEEYISQVTFARLESFNETHSVFHYLPGQTDKTVFPGKRHTIYFS